MPARPRPLPRPRPRSGRKDGYHHGDLRRALVDEAVRLVAEKGVAALTLRESARRAGVSQAAPYRHFPSKDALVAAVAEEGFRALLDRVRRTLAHAPAEPLGRLQALGATYVRFAVDHPAHFRVMFGREVAESHGFTGLWEAAQAGYAELLREIEAGQRSRAIAGDDPRRPALAAWSAVHGLASLLVDGLLARQGLGPGPRGSVEALARDVTRSLFEGLSQKARRRRSGGAR